MPPPKKSTMPSHWIVYWIPDEIAAALEDGAIARAQGNQLSKVKPGDTLWICGKRPNEDLTTIGYLKVTVVLSADQARTEFGDTIRYFADHFVEADLCRTRSVSLRPLYQELRFESATSQRLTLGPDGQPSPQQLQTYRRLTLASANLMQRLWNGGSLRPEQAGPATSGSPRTLLNGAYRPASRPTGDATTVVMELNRDPAKLERALAAHADTQDRLAAILIAQGLTPLSPFGEEPDFDLAWRNVGTSVINLVEVKSLTDLNEATQMRLGVGQLLHYAGQLLDLDPNLEVRPVLALEHRPQDTTWGRVCKTAGITLVCGPNFEGFSTHSGLSTTG